MSSDEQLIRLILFFCALALGSHIANIVHQSPILVHLILGAILGPPLTDFVPIEKGLSLAGFLGITISVIEAGLSTRLSQIRTCALRALLVAFLGVLFPIGGACIIMFTTQQNIGTKVDIKTVFVIGSAIAPTSLGVTANLLSKANELDTSIGTLISVAAVFDDALSLILLAQLSNISSSTSSTSSTSTSSISTWKIIKPLLFSFLFILFAVIIAAILPICFNVFLRLIHPYYTIPSIFGLWLLIVISTLLIFIASKIGTSVLLAAYLSGVSFASVREDMSSIPWTERISPYSPFLTILFFASTIGFVIPLNVLFDTQALALGALLSIPSIFGKLLCGIAMYPNWIDGFAVGVAMLGRGEFGFLIAAQAKETGLLTQREYAAVTWGVIVPTILTPILFPIVFGYRKKKIETSKENENDNSTSSNSHNNNNGNVNVHVHVDDLNVSPRLDNDDDSINDDPVQLVNVTDKEQVRNTETVSPVQDATKEERNIDEEIMPVSKLTGK